MDYLAIVFRFLHIFSAITLIGGSIAWVYAVLPGFRALTPELGATAENTAAAAWRPLVVLSIAGLLISGVWNFLHKTGLTPAWHSVFGVKILLALHIFAVTFLATKPDNRKRARQLTGVVISGVVVIGLSAVLRYLSTR